MGYGPIPIKKSASSLDSRNGCDRNVSKQPQRPAPARPAPNGKEIPTERKSLSRLSVFVKKIRHRQLFLPSTALQGPAGRPSIRSAMPLGHRQSVGRVSTLSAPSRPEREKAVFGGPLFHGAGITAPGSRC